TTRPQDEVALSTQHGTHGCAESLREAQRHRVEVTADRGDGDPEFHRGIESARAIQVQPEPVRVGERACALQVVGRQHLAAYRVLQAQQAGAREMVVVGLDRGGNLPEIETAVRAELERLRLDAAQYRRTAALVFVRMRLLPDDV